MIDYPSVYELSLEGKIGQVFITSIPKNEFNEDVKKLIEQTSLGNIIYYGWANEYHCPESVTWLSEELATWIIEKTAVKPLIAIDQEGGVITRLQNGFSFLPGNMAIAATGEIKNAFFSGYILGKQMRACGINLNLAPTVDVNNNPQNPIIGVRSFGDDPNNVAECGKEFINGLHKAHVLATLKHFPGHGNTSMDSHHTLPFIKKELEELKKVEFLPFKELHSMTDVIMMGHLLVPALDPINCATKSPNVLNYLREQIGFKGVIITDSLTMKAISPSQDSFDQKVLSISRSAIDAFKAGCDLLLLVEDQLSSSDSLNLIREVINNFKKALLNKEISEERLNQSVERILNLKKQIHPCPKECFSEEDEEIAEKMAKQAVTLLSPLSLFERSDTSLKNKKTLYLVPEKINYLCEKGVKLFQGEEPTVMVIPDTEDVESLIKCALSYIENIETLICFTYTSRMNNPQITFYQKLADLLVDKKIILISLKNPFDFAPSFYQKVLTLATYSPSPYSIKAALDYLQCHEAPKGNLPQKQDLVHSY